MVQVHHRSGRCFRRCVGCRVDSHALHPGVRRPSVGADLRARVRIPRRWGRTPSLLCWGSSSFFVFRWVVSAVIIRRRERRIDDEIVDAVRSLDVIRGRHHAVTASSGAEIARIIRWRNARDLRSARALLGGGDRLVESSGRTGARDLPTVPRRKSCSNLASRSTAPPWR